MPKFAPNTGFKMPGVGSKEIDSPSNFRDEQHVDKVGYCDTTEDSMLPKGSSPLKVRYTSSGYLKDLDAITIPVSKKSDTKKSPPPSSSKKPPTTKRNTTNFSDKIEIDPIKVKQPKFTELSPPSSKSEVPVSKPKKVDKVRYTDLPKEQRDAARKWNLEKHGTHKTTELSKATKGKKGFDTSFEYTGDRGEAVEKKRKQMGYIN